MANFRIHFSNANSLCYKRSIKLKAWIQHLSEFMNTGTNPEYIFYNLSSMESIINNHQMQPNTINPKDNAWFCNLFAWAEAKFPFLLYVLDRQLLTTARTLVQQWPTRFWSSQVWEINSHTLKTYWLNSSISDSLSAWFNKVGMKYPKYHSVFNWNTSPSQHWIYVSSR